MFLKCPPELVELCPQANHKVFSFGLRNTEKAIYTLWLGLKRYAQTTIRYDTRYGAHDTICSAIHLPFLAGKQRLVIPACDQKHRTPPIATACAVMMLNGYNNGGLLRVSRCGVFVMNLLVLLEYTGCYLWYLMFISYFSVTTVPYLIVSSSEHIAICTAASVSAVYRCAGVSFQPYLWCSHWSENYLFSAWNINDIFSVSSFFDVSSKRFFLLEIYIIYSRLLYIWISVQTDGLMNISISFNDTMNGDLFMHSNLFKHVLS